jgi:hypothetical protein
MRCIDGAYFNPRAATAKAQPVVLNWCHWATIDNLNLAIVELAIAQAAQAAVDSPDT